MKVTYTYIWVACAWFAQVYLVYALPEVADEAYYAQWGHDLHWGYFDHPPGVALWSAWGGRVLNLFILPWAWLGFGVAAKKLGAGFPLHHLVLFAWSTPLGLASGVLVTPDTPLLLSWSLAVLGYATKSMFLLILGLTMGLWSKAMIIPASIGVLWLCWTDQRLQKKTRQLRVMSVICITSILYLPHIYWSYSHDWLPWSFQGGRTWKAFGVFEFLGGQLAVGGGLITLYFFKLIYDYLSVLYHRTYDVSWSRERIWFWLSAPSMLTWLLVSVFTSVEANWTALAWPIGLVWFLESTSPSQQEKALKVTCLITIPCILLPTLHHYIPLAWGPPRDGNKLSSCIEKVYHSSPVNPPLLVAARYQEAALLDLSLTQSSSYSRVHRIPIIYLKAHQRRASQYDLSWSRVAKKTLSLPCHTLWLGPQSWVGHYCEAQSIPILKSDDHCRLSLSTCICESK